MSEVTGSERLLITPREAARTLSISEKSLYCATKRGEIPVVRVGVRSVRYSTEALRQWIAKQQATCSEAVAAT